jgi:hypothetical protein
MDDARLELVRRLLAEAARRKLGATAAREIPYPRAKGDCLANWSSFPPKNQVIDLTTKDRSVDNVLQKLILVWSSMDGSSRQRVSIPVQGKNAGLKQLNYSRSFLSLSKG